MTKLGQYLCRQSNWNKTVDNKCRFLYYYSNDRRRISDFIVAEYFVVFVDRNFRAFFPSVYPSEHEERVCGLTAPPLLDVRRGKHWPRLQLATHNCRWKGAWERNLDSRPFCRNILAIVEQRCSHATSPASHRRLCLLLKDDRGSNAVPSLTLSLMKFVPEAWVVTVRAIIVYFQGHMFVAMLLVTAFTMILCKIDKHHSIFRRFSSFKIIHIVIHSENNFLTRLIKNCFIRKLYDFEVDEMWRINLCVLESFQGHLYFLSNC